MKKTVAYLAVILLLAVSASTVHASDLLTVTIVNNSDQYSDDQVYVQMVGTDPGGSGNYGHVDLDTSTWIAMSPSDNTVTPPGGPWPQTYTNYSKILSELTPAGSHTWSFQMPNIISGRIYVSFGQPAYFHAYSATNYDAPSSVNPSLPNYSIIFDKVELDWENGQEPFLNTTTVDFFSIGFMLSLQLTDGTSQQRGFTQTRQQIMENLTALPAIWQNGLVTNGSSVVRFNAPQVLSAPNPFADYFDSYVTECWNYYTSAPLTLQNLPDVEPWTATGQVIGGVFTFTVAGTGEVVTINNLVGQSVHIFGCDGAGYLFTTGSDSIPRQEIITQMGAALNRGVLKNIPDSATWWNNPSQFYQQEPTNLYAKVLHAASYQGYCYGLPYDDVGNYSSGVTGNATGAVITIQSMSDQFPIELTPNKTTFSTQDKISVTANVQPSATRFYPVVWLDMPNGKSLYYVKGKGFYSSPKPYLHGGPFVLKKPINNFPVLSAGFKVPAGTYCLNGAAVDATQTKSVKNLVYIGGVNRTQLTVQ